MKERKEIDDKYKWDLSCYIKDEKMLNDEIEYLKNTYPQFKKFENKLNNRNYLLEMFKLNDEFSNRYGRLLTYIHCSISQDSADTYFLSLSNKMSFLDKQISEATAFIEPQLDELSDDFLDDLYKDNDFVEYKNRIERIKERKKHKISEYDSKMFSKMGMFLGSASSIYDTLTTGEIQFADIKVGDETIKVDEPSYSKLITSKNREIRKKGMLSIMQGYGDKIKTLTETYTSHIHENIFFATLRKFNSVRESSMFYEEVNPVVYDKLISKINDNVDCLQEYLEQKRKALGLEKMAIYDTAVPLLKDEEYTIEQAIELVKIATKPLGDEYAKILEEKFNEKVIDFLPNKNKDSGAYSTSEYGCPSVVLMNFVGNLNSVSTLAHEIGHAMHSEFTNRTQNYNNSGYEIFVAEVASIVNELLLHNYLVENTDEESKKSLVYEFLDDVRTTIFRQTLFSEFEDWAHNQLETEQPITYEDFNNQYYSLLKKYYGEKLEIPEELKYEWSRIPHFYTDFYVYKYATGFISALCVVQNMQKDKEYYKKYINFLKSGSSKKVLELLKDIDIDLTTDQPYNSAFEYIRGQLKLIK